MLLATMKITVRVPATTANLGPGFDCLGLALQVWNTVTLEESEQNEVEWRPCPRAFRLDPVPFDAARLPGPNGNLVFKAIGLYLSRASIQPSPFRLTLTDCIPIGRGLGSSAAAIVGGLVAANAWSGKGLSVEQLLTLATEIEGHPDNVSAALYGGLTISASDGPRIIARQLAPPRPWRAVIFVPVQRLSTRLARSVLPRRVPRADAIFNVGRTALLVRAFATGDPEVLDFAMHDALHQPYRARLIPWMQELFAAAREAGACGTALSGAGPTLIAFVENADKAEGVRRAFAERAGALNVAGAAHVVGLSARGAHVWNHR